MQRKLGGSERDLSKDNQDIWVQITDLGFETCLMVVYMNPWWIFSFAKPQKQVFTERIPLGEESAQPMKSRR